MHNSRLNHRNIDDIEPNNSKMMGEVYSEQRKRSIQENLLRKLGPEFVCQRQGPGGVKLSYLEGWRCIQIANEIFGFEGWSHTIVDITVDFLDCVDGKFSLGVSAVVRVSIKGGGSHEDVGYGSIDNSRSKALAFEKAKKEAVTDALKRAMRAYGNSLGNCLYDKDYTKRVAKFGKPKYRELKVDDMYRERTDFVIEEPVAPKVVHQPMPAGPTTSVVQKVVAVEDEFAEFDDDILPADIETWDSCNLAASPVPHQLSGAQVSIGPHTQRLSQIQPANRNHSQNGFTFASQLVSTNAPPMGNTTRPSVVMHQRPSLNAAPALSNINQPKRAATDMTDGNNSDKKRFHPTSYH